MNNVLTLICGAVLCITLALGLWPFHSPNNNNIVWLRNQDGLRFGPYGLAVGSDTFPAVSSSDVTLEIWFRPKRIWDSGTFLAFYESRNLFQFSLRQSQTTLLLKATAKDNRHHVRTAVLSVDEAFNRANRPVFLSITAGNQGPRIYLDGRLAKAATEFPLTAKNLTGHLVLGDSPGQSDSWSGEIRGLAIYNQTLTAKQVFEHYSTWVQTGRPEIAEDERNTTLYLFDERSGVVVRDKGTSRVNLDIPKRYRVMDKITLEPFWTEFEMTRSYWDAVVKNIVGFIPFGFWFYAYLTMLLPGKRVTLLTVCLGTAVSFTIEILQAALPTRDSGTTDIITNTMGAWIGAALYDLSTPILVRLFPWWPFPPAKKPKVTG